MPALVALLLLIGVACTTAPKIKKETGQTEAVPAHRELVSTLDLLTAVHDWPSDTKRVQAKYGLTKENVGGLINALHPRWDKLINQTAEDMESWTTYHMQDILNCRQECDCHFYHEVLERRPSLKLKLTEKELTALEKLAKSRSKSFILGCLERDGQDHHALIKELKEESKDHEADSAY